MASRPAQRHPSDNAFSILTAQHAELRRIMTRCELFAAQRETGHCESETLVTEVAKLRTTLAEHNRDEERLLPLLLGHVDRARLDQMVLEHTCEHREILDGLDVIGELRRMLQDLRNHLALEDRYFLTTILRPAADHDG